MSATEILRAVLVEIATAAAEGAAYEAWSDDFARKEVSRAWTDAEAPLRRQRKARITVADLQEIGEPDLRALGFMRWDKDLIAIPLYAFNYIADGERLQCIDGTTVIKGTDEIDLDVRGGCIAFGIHRQRHDEAA